jgi:hypothetical protein
VNLPRFRVENTSVAPSVELAFLASTSASITIFAVLPASILVSENVEEAT